MPRAPDHSRVNQRRDDADDAGGRGTQQCHRENQGEERAGNPDAAELNRERIAADREHQEEQDKLDR